MSPARTISTARMSESNSAQREAMRRLVRGVYDGIRQGKLRVVEPNPNAPFRPRMEIFNDPDSPNVIATFELPGVKIADLSISVKQGVLLIHGERQPRYRRRQRHPSVRGQPQAEAGDNMDVDSAAASRASEAHARLFPKEELRYGQFRRAVRLPTGADTSCISASLSDGLLTVTWPRQPLGPKQLDGTTTAPTVHSVLERPTSSVRAEPHGANQFNDAQ
ncbi:HSP20-like chaperone [Mycena polygramma]|nr:HSP20-like chaperone [Mycena polygramma]